MLVKVTLMMNICIKILVRRCTKIKELRFACLHNRKDSMTHIIDHLSPTLEQLELTNCSVDYKEMFPLKLMPKLKILDCLLYRWEIVHELREQLPDVSVNGYPPMATVCKKKKVTYDRHFYNERSEYECDNDIWYKCPTCNAEFEEERELNDHDLNFHEGKNLYKCDLCGSAFARMNELNRHKNNVHEKNTATHHCQCCNEDFSENLG